MGDESAPVPAHEATADWLATRESTTFSDVLVAGPLVLATLAESYPTRLAALRAAHSSWVQRGRPADSRPVAPPATAREAARPPAASPEVNVPDPNTATMKTLLAGGPRVFAEFKARHPEAFDAIARGAGLPPSRP